MEITVNADEAYYLTDALKHAIRRVEKHAKKVNKVLSHSIISFASKLRLPPWARESSALSTPASAGIGFPVFQLPDR